MVRMQAHVEESLESNYTCLMCLKVFDDPVACVPCGHCFCRKCFESGCSSSDDNSVGWCQECGGIEVQQLISLGNLSHLANKFAFKLGALQDLRAMCGVRS